MQACRFTSQGTVEKVSQETAPAWTRRWLQLEEGGDEQTAIRYCLIRKHQSPTHLTIKYFTSVLCESTLCGMNTLFWLGSPRIGYFIDFMVPKYYKYTRVVIVQVLLVKIVKYEILQFDKHSAIQGCTVGLLLASIKLSRGSTPLISLLLVDSVSLELLSESV
jgi:hypothetical protein